MRKYKILNDFIIKKCNIFPFTLIIQPFITQKFTLYIVTKLKHYELQAKQFTISATTKHTYYTIIYNENFQKIFNPLRT